MEFKNILSFKERLLCGVYKIQFDNNRYYMGSSVDIRRRIIEHRSAVNTKKHINKYLQNVWSKYKKPKEIVIILVPREDLIKVEQFYLDANINDVLCININPNADRPTRKEIPIHQYTLDGKFIRSWKSGKEIGDMLGIQRSSISSVATNNTKSAGGFRWSYTKEENLPVLERGYHEDKIYSYLVCQYNLFGEFIRTYDTVREAAKDNNDPLFGSYINECTKDFNRISLNSRWKRIKRGEPIPTKIDVTVPTQYLAIDQYTKEGVFIKRWKNTTELRTVYRPSVVDDIVSVCRKKRTSCIDYLWKFENDESVPIYKDRRYK